MDTPPATKTCKMCRMEIPRKARKCPHCQHFQSYSSVLIALVPLLPFLFLMVFMRQFFNQGENFEKYSGQITVTESEIAFGDSNKGPTVAVLGTMKNSSPVSWKQVELHVDFLDATGKRVDVGERGDLIYRVPAGGTSTFKVSFPREFPDASYAKAAVRVAGAKDVRARF